MRILNKTISHKNGSGSVRIQPEQPEDMWHLYNLIAENDKIRSTTVRNVS
jgi:protein pelota